MFFFNFIYYFISEAIFKTTFGKIITGSVVVDNEGKPITAYQTFYRTLWRLVPLEAFSFCLQKEVGMML